MQADAPFRMNPEDLNQLYVRNSRGPMVPFSVLRQGLVDVRLAAAPALQRRVGHRDPGPGGARQEHRPGDAAMERLMQANCRPASATSGPASRCSSSSRARRRRYFYALSILVVFLSLAALYESWSIPISVILVVPLGVLGALAAATLFGMSNDVYFQVGLLTTIGLSAKNAILIVEFARELHAQGRSALEAAVEAAHMRLRPIIMTSLAFVLGVLPLALASGAGSASQNAIGTGVIGGMLAATFLAPFLIPMFYVVVADKLFKSKTEPGADRRLSAASAVRRPRSENASPHWRSLRCSGAGRAVARCSRSTSGPTRRSPPRFRPATRTTRYAGSARQARCRRPTSAGAISSPIRACSGWWRSRCKQPRPARRGAERGAGPGAIPRAARRPVSAGRGLPSRRASRTPAASRAAASRLVRTTIRWAFRRLGDRLLRPPAEPERCGARAILRDRARPPGLEILLVSQVADQYLTMLAFDEQLAVTRSTLETAQARTSSCSCSSRPAPHRAGPAQAQTVVEQARANHAAQVRLRAQAENALVLLLGQPLPPTCRRRCG